MVNSSVYTLVLAGIITSAFFEALISTIKFVADPLSKLPTITYWLMGSMASIAWRDLMMTAPIIGFGIAGLLIMRWRLNILSLDDDEARSMGININASRIMVIIFCTLITAASVSVCGIVGWVGLVIPHIGRIIVGPNHKNLLPACLSVGAVYLLLIDNLARSLVSTEIPLSILTALVGAPFFAYLLKRSRWSVVMKLIVEHGKYGYSFDNLLYDDINFSINEGEILTILGPNGVGKTTLLRCITSLLKWHSGQNNY